MNKSMTLLASLWSIACLFFLLNYNAMSDEGKQRAALPEIKEGLEQITLGAGCFWCVEAVYNRLEGVTSVTSGYMGGTKENPTYEDVTRRNSGEVEVVHIVFDPKKISYSTLLKWFWDLHDPTQINGQGADIGPQYRSTIFYHTEAQKAAAAVSKNEAQKKFTKPIATIIKKADTFYPAEIYHQDYYRLNKNKNPYCQAVITPKLEKLGLEDKPDVGK